MPIQYFTQNLTVTAGAYSTNDVIGGLITFTGLRRGSLQTVTITDKAAQSSDYKLVLFNAAPTIIADNATYDIADADLVKIIKQINLTNASHRESFTDNAVYTVGGLDIPIAASCPSITAFLIATASAPTYDSTSDVSVVLQVDTDYVSGRNQGSSNIDAIQVGDAAGGELSGTYPVPAVNATHSGSSHINLPAGAQANGVNLMTISSNNNVTNKTIDADNNTISNLAHGAEVDNPSSGVHGATGTVVGTSDTQTLSNKTISDDLTMQDNAAIALGTGGDARLYYDGGDTFLDLRAVGTGDMMIALAGSFPAPDADTVHIWKGNAGVVSASTSSALVLEDNADCGITILTTSADVGFIYFGDQSNNAVGRIRYDHSGGDMEFYVEGATKMQIDATDLRLVDNVGAAFGGGSDSRIYYNGTDTFWDLRATGTGDLMIALAGSFPSPDSDNVHIWRGSAGAIQASANTALTIEDSQATGISILTTSADAARIYFGDESSNASGQVRYDHASDRFEFYTAGTNRVRIDASGDVDLLTGGINFPDAQVTSSDVNTLDDYEEGTYTPTLTFNTPGDLNVVHGTTTGYYTKIGDVCHCWGQISTTTFTHTTASGNLELGGLPFVIASSSISLAGGGHWRGITKTADVITYNPAPTTSHTRMVASTSGGVNSNVSAADMPTGGTVTLRYHFAYIV